MLTIFGVDDLEVLNGGLSDSAVEVQHVGRRLLVPDWSLVPQLDEVLQVPILVPDQQPVVVLEEVSTALFINHTVNSQLASSVNCPG